jgi:hypothetical protein
MQTFFKWIAVLLLSMCAAATVYAKNDPSYNLTPREHFTAKVNLYNQSDYSYTVNATYVSQSGPSRKYVMTLYPYGLSGSSIQFPIVLPEYAVYLQVVRNIDGYITYTGYLSSDDVYIRNGQDKQTKVEISHR